MRYTLAQRKFALRMTRRAATMAARKGEVFDNTNILWTLMVEASHKPKARRQPRKK